MPAPRSGFTAAVPTSIRTYDNLPGGQHFIGMVPAGQAPSGLASVAQIQVVVNWFEDVKQRASGR